MPLPLLEKQKNQKNHEKSFLNLIHDSGHPNIKLEKKIDFQKLYEERSN